MHQFDLRIFLRNHCDETAWSKLPPAVRRLFPAPDGSLAHAGFFTVGPGRRGYRFELLVEVAGQQSWLPAEWVIHQSNWGMVTLVRSDTETRPWAESHSAEAVRSGRFAPATRSRRQRRHQPR